MQSPYKRKLIAPAGSSLAFAAAPDECYVRMRKRVASPVVEPLSTGDRPVFERAFREHYENLVAFVRHRVGSDAEASDIAQEAYLRVLRYRDGQDQSALRALLFQIAGNLIGMRARMARAQHWADRVPAEQEDSLIASEPPLDLQAASEQEFARLLKVIERLPTKCRNVFVLNRLHGMSFAEIGSRLGISAKMVEKYVYKGLAECRRKLGGERP